MEVVIQTPAPLKIITIYLLTCLLAACGGGGGGSDSPAPTTQESSNTTPIADAGATQAVDEGRTAVLNGRDSSDADGDTLRYTWSQVSGPEVALSSAAVAQPQFTAPSVSEDEVLTFQLVVNDGTVDSSADTVELRVLDVNQKPVADAGSNQTVEENSTATLDGTNSSDAEGDALNYSWVQLSGSSVTLSDSNATQPTFTAPELSADENLVFRLTVDDGTTSASDEVTVSVQADDDAPSADAGGDQEVNSGDVVVLDGSASADPDSTTLTYSWTGPSYIALSDPSARSPSFVAGTSSNGGFPEAHIFTLEVQDEGGNTDSDSVTIQIATSLLEEVYSVVGENEDDVLGASIAHLADLDNDGIAEFAVGALRFDGMGGTDSGAVYIRSGADGSKLATMEGEANNDYFGRSISTLGDLNNDGFDELIIGANGAGDNGKGRVYVYSGNLAHHQPDSATNPLLFVVEDTAVRAIGSSVSAFGWSTSSVPDVNNDGHDDIAVGAPLSSHPEGQFSTSVPAGRVYVFSGNRHQYGTGPASDNILFFIDGEAAGDEFGTSVASVDSLLNRFDWQDLVIGAPGHNGIATNSGKVYVYTAQPDFYAEDSSIEPLLYELEGESAGDYYGYAIELLDDIDDDGYPELVIGAPSFEPNDGVNGAGAVYVHSGSGWSDNEVLFKLDGRTAGDQFGGSVAVLEDANGDSFADIGVSAFRHAVNDWDVLGSLSVFSGNPSDNSADQTRLYFWNGEQLGNTVSQVSSFVDVDGDGINEILMSASVFSVGTATKEGKVYLLSQPE